MYAVPLGKQGLAQMALWTEGSSAIQPFLRESEIHILYREIKFKKFKKKRKFPRTGIEPVTFRLYVSITAERDIQLHHRGFDCDDLLQSFHASTL